MILLYDRAQERLTAWDLFALMCGEEHESVILGYFSENKDVINSGIKGPFFLGIRKAVSNCLNRLYCVHSSSALTGWNLSYAGAVIKWLSFQFNWKWKMPNPLWKEQGMSSRNSCQTKSSPGLQCQLVCCNSFCVFRGVPWLHVSLEPFYFLIPNGLYCKPYSTSLMANRKEGLADPHTMQ